MPSQMLSLPERLLAALGNLCGDAKGSWADAWERDRPEDLP